MEQSLESAKRRAPTWALWLVWLLGPATYGAAFAYFLAFPDFCNPIDGLPFACGLKATHLAAGIGTLLLLALPGPRSQPEFWLLVLYWAGIAGWIPLGEWVGPRVAFVCTRISAAMVVLMPVVGLARLLRR